MKRVHFAESPVQIRDVRQETLEDPSVGYVKDQDAELLATIEEAAFQAVVDYWISKKARARLSSSEAPSDCSSLPFPQKLWKVLESGQFQSVRWDETATCVLINKDLIKNEIAEKKGILKLFGWSCLKSFQRQLQLYGFRQTRLDGQSEAAPVGKVKGVGFIRVFNHRLDPRRDITGAGAGKVFFHRLRPGSDVKRARWNLT